MPPNDKIRNHLVAKPIVNRTSKSKNQWFENFKRILCTQMTFYDSKYIVEYIGFIGIVIFFV